MNRLIIAAALCSAVLQLVSATTVCGKQGLHVRIYGGTKAVPGEWPWHATLSFKAKPFCGGTLIADKWLVTAAHCFDPTPTETIAVKRDPKQWAVHLGFSRMGFIPEESSAITVVPSRILLHENYTNYFQGNDIALVELSHPVNFTRFISPVCLPETDHRFHLRSTCYATGLQDVPEGVPLDSERYLEKVAQTLIGWRTCNCIYNTHIRPEESNPAKPDMLCILESDGKKGPCVGDSGGPVVCNEDGTWFLAGAISFSQGCHLRDSPTILTAVSSYQDWISRWTDSTAAFSPQTIVVTDDVDNDTCSDLLSNKTSGCGISEADVSGTSSPGPWPWQVDLWRDGHRACGGALISANWVITAAQCFTSPDSSESSSDWSVSVATGTPAMRNFTVQKISIHGSYISYEDGNNVALVQLSQPAPLGPYIQPICLPHSSHRMPYAASCWHTGGAGLLLDGRMEPPRGVKLELIGPNQCNCLYSQPKSANHSVSILPGMLCASRLGGNGSQCLSDSGGPLACKENGTWFLIGVRSFGGECEKEPGAALPGVFTQLAKYEDWISRTTRDGFFIPQIYSPPAEMDTDRCSYNSPRGCGRSVTSPGSEPVGDAIETTWPWQVSLQIYDTHVCSSVLIAETWFLTAAHCIPRFTAISDYTVLLGRQLQYGENPREVTRTIKRVVYHPEYRMKTGENDLALVEMYYGITYSDYIMPICLPPDQTFPPATGCWVSGWGRLHPSESISFLPPLRHLEVSLLDGKNCGSQGNVSGGGRGEQLCVASNSDKMFSCLFDSSTPLVCQTRPGGPWYLFGVGSQRSPSVRNSCPGNFTEVLPTMSWIRQLVPRSDLNELQVKETILEVGYNGIATTGTATVSTPLLNSTAVTAQKMPQSTNTSHLTSDVPPTPLLNSTTIMPQSTNTPYLTSDVPPTPLLNSTTIMPQSTNTSHLTSDVPPTPLLNSTTIMPQSNHTTHLTSDVPPTPLLNSTTIMPQSNHTTHLTSDVPPTPLLNSTTIMPQSNHTTHLASDVPPTPLLNSTAIMPQSTDTSHLTSDVPPGGDYNLTTKMDGPCLEHSGEHRVTCADDTTTAPHNINSTSSGFTGKKPTTGSGAESLRWSWLLHGFLVVLCLGLC